MTDLVQNTVNSTTGKQNSVAHTVQYIHAVRCEQYIIVYIATVYRSSWCAVHHMVG